MNKASWNYMYFYNNVMTAISYYVPIFADISRVLGLLQEAIHK